MPYDPTLSVNKYMTATPPEGSTPLEVVAFIWTTPTRTPEFLKSHKDTLRKEWPELWDALNALVSAEGEAASTPIHFIEAQSAPGHDLEVGK